ncbi:uncharacterized protein LOC128390179 [Panonychus citri]|uniref:uncharacterized protein LOC128390179 n=1 Tax=Panonychus citri TaxID=50023 RepID=UPI00230725B4|nr:uncharacterized protein LOC128390179 [Panonychus citri]
MISSSSSSSPPPPPPPSSSSSSSSTLPSESDEEEFMNYLRDFLNQRGPLNHKIDLIFSLIERVPSLTERKKYIVRRICKYALNRLITARATTITRNLNSKIDELVDQCKAIDEQFNAEAKRNIQLFQENWLLKTSLQISEGEDG